MIQYYNDFSNYPNLTNTTNLGFNIVKAASGSGSIVSSSYWNSKAFRLFQTSNAQSWCVNNSINFSDGIITARISLSGLTTLNNTSLAGIIFRSKVINTALNAPGPCYSFYIDSGVPNNLVFNHINAAGSVTTSSTATVPISDFRDFTMKIVASGSQLECYIDGSSGLFVTNTVIQDGGIGFRTSSASNGLLSNSPYFGNLTVENFLTRPFDLVVI